MWMKRRCPIATDETGGGLHGRLSLIGAEALMQALPGIMDGSMTPEIQDDAQTCYARKLEKAEASIDWMRQAEELDRQVRAFNPWPVAQADYAGKVLRIWQSHVLPGGEGARPGTVVGTGKEGIDVATGDGLLRITRLQLPGKKALSAADFLNAHNLDGVVFG